MEKRKADGWRAAIRAHLIEHVGRTMLMGELFDLFCYSIPLEQASRLWTHGSNVDATGDQMRRNAVVLFLHRLNIELSPPDGRGHRFRTVTARFMPCAVCQTPFLAARWQTAGRTRTCSRQCSRVDDGTIADRAARREAREARQRMEQHAE
jgi:hypothetical protein